MIGFLLAKIVDDARRTNLREQVDETPTRCHIMIDPANSLFWHYNYMDRNRIFF